MPFCSWLGEFYREWVLNCVECGCCNGCAQERHAVLEELGGLSFVLAAQGPLSRLPSTLSTLPWWGKGGRSGEQDAGSSFWTMQGLGPGWVGRSGPHLSPGGHPTPHSGFSGVPAVSHCLQQCLAQGGPPVNVLLDRDTPHRQLSVCGSVSPLTSLSYAQTVLTDI